MNKPVEIALRKQQYLLFFVILSTLSSCRMFEIGEPPRKEVIEYSQNNPLGAVLLFKTELDSNNTPAATGLLAQPNGQHYLAIEQVEMYDEIDRLKRLISRKPVTRIRADTLNNNSLEINVELEYLRNLSFTTLKINENWYIVNYDDGVRN